MENFRAMAIGIDGYHYCQPLTHSETNAQQLYKYLSQDTEIPDQNLLLLTDTSPQLEPYSTYPNRENIRNWLEYWPNQTKLGWFFFQGYGINDQGKDYLIPIDGHPEAIAETGLEMRSLLETLQLKTQRLLIILDVNLAHQDKGFKKRAIALAKARGIALIIMVSSVQSSEKLFITALLEALRYYGTHLTLTNLEAYFQERLTPLGSNRDSSIVIPTVVSPSVAAGRLPLLPLSNSPVRSDRQQVVSGRRQTSSNRFSKSLGSVTLPVLPKSSPAVMPFPESSLPSNSFLYSLKFYLRTYGKWFFLVALVCFLLGFFGLTWFKLTRYDLAINDLKEESNERNIRKNRQVLNYAKTLVSYNQASRLNQAIQVARQIQPNTPFYQEAQDNITRWSQGIWEISQGRAVEGNFKGAIAAAQLVPPDRPRFYDLAQQSIQHWQQFSK
ncbi:MAG TPA: hypothetical protein DCF68_22620 [Cyanothece sp. UBA12306]|nr:hypothetical protein [Cyanothece sp. UBA12306]